MGFIDHLFSADGFMPHGHCYLWRPGVLWLHILSDALITLAYFSIPFTLVYFVRKRKDLEFDWMFLCFAVFIVACGTTHLMEIWVIWHPTYWLSGAVKAITALASVPTAILLVKLIPDALRLPSPSSLRKANDQLEREINERKRAEEGVRLLNDELEARVAQRTQALKENQQLLQAIVDNATAVIYVKDLEGRYLLVNSRFTKLFHLSQAAALAKTDYDVFSKPEADAFRAMDQRVLAAGVALTEEETAAHDDGPHTYLSVKCPLRDCKGQPYAIFGISTDITGRVQAEHNLQSQLRRLDLLSHITRAIAERQDLASIFQIVAASLEEHFPAEFACLCLCDDEKSGLTVASAGNRSGALLSELTTSNERRIPIEQNGLARCIQGQLVFESDISRCESSFTRELAQKGLRSLVLAPLRVESAVFGVLMVARREADGFSAADCDFLQHLSEHVALAAHQAQLYQALQAAYDDLRQTQQTAMQQERLRALGQMASGVAHDINNALSPVTLYTESLLEREPNLTQRGRNYLETIQRAIEDVSQTVGRMREFCRPREGLTATSPVDLNQMIQQVMRLTRAKWSDIAQQRGVVIQTEGDLDAQLPAISGVESEIREALINLVFNAVDAMPEGGRLLVRTKRVEGRNAPRAAVEVSDSGIGMDEETRRRCLEPFFTTKGERGTGLGLAMVYGAMQRHGGDIEIDSQPGKGTTVRLIFSGAAIIPNKNRGSQFAPLASWRTRILVVDDDPMLLKSLENTLGSDGHVVVAANGGEEGIRLFRDALERGEPFGVVITDLGMPHVDGRKVAAAIKEVSPRTPVIMLTGWGKRLKEEGTIPACVDHLLDKPPKLMQLREVLAACCQSGTEKGAAEQTQA